MASTKLTRTPSTTTTVDAWTFSVWLKRSSTGTSHDICSGRNNTDGGNNQSTFSFDANDNLYFDVYNGGSIVVKFITNRKFRDLNFWYHIVLDFDSSTAGARSAADRMKVWVNGIRETSFSTEVQSGADQETNFCQQNDCPIAIGANAGLRTATYNGLMSHINYVAGVGYPASYFGETDATTGIWKPKGFSGSYGTNGFFLKFENSGSMGTDSSSNGNNFTVNGTPTQTVDTPTNVFATLNPLLDVYAVGTYSNGNLGLTGTGSTNFGGCSMPVSKGKWYVEVKATTVNGSYPIIGVIDAQSSKRRDDTYFVGADIDTNNPSGFAVFSNGDIYHNNSSSYGNLTTTYTSGDIIGMALDMDSATKTLAFYKNGTLETTINLDEPPSGSYIFCTAIYATASSAKTDWNFGNGYFGTSAVSSATSDESGLGIFEHTVPSGYNCLCTKNINTYG